MQAENKTTSPTSCSSACYGPWEDGKENWIHISECEDDDCTRCDHLTEFYMCCDSCGHVGHMDSGGWYLKDGIPYCNEVCAGS